MAILGVDIGGTGLKAALVDTTNGALVSERQRVDTPESRQPEDVLPAVVELIKGFDYNGPLGIGFPAVVAHGVPLTPFTAYQIQSWVGYPVADKISEMSGMPVTLLNDADAAGIAEMRFGAGVNQGGVVIVITLGTGIGSAMFVDGRLVPNTEFGHLYLRNRKNVVEQSTSEKARIEQKLKWAKWAGRLDLYLHHLERIFTPDLFIIGGGASKEHERFIPLLTTRAPVVPAALQNEAGIVGAAMATL